MQFLAPLFLAGLAAVAIPVWIHLVRQHRAPLVPFTAVTMIKAAPVEQRSMRRLRDVVLLSLRAAAIALLALAFARPFFAEAASAEPVTMVVVDVSASMAGEARFASARAAARKAIDEAPDGHRIGVGAFDHTGRTVLLPQSDRDAARASVDRLQPGFGATRYAAALAGASDVFDRAPGRIVVVTDRQRAGWAGEAAARVPRGVDVVWAPIEPPVKNAAVTALVVRGGLLRATLVNGGRAAVSERVIVTARSSSGGADAKIAERAVEMQPGQTQIVEFAESVPSSGDVAVRVSDAGGVPADDTRHLVLDPAAPRRVLIVTSGLDEDREAYYVRHALDASGAVGRADVRIAGGTTLRERFAEALAGIDVAIVLSTRGIERSGPEAIKAFRARGGGVLLVAGPSAEPAVLSAMLDAGETRAVPGAAVADAFVLSDARHPVFRSLGALAGGLGSIRVTRSMFVEAPQLAVLARYTSGAPALAERRRAAAEGRTLLLTTDVANAWNDLALHPAFVPLVHEMTAHLDGRARREREYLVGAPDAPGDRPGVVSATGPAGWRTAVNVDPAESDSEIFLDAEARARIVADDRAEQKAAADLEEREAEHPLWRYAIVFMMGALLVEGVMGRSARPGSARQTTSRQHSAPDSL